MGTAPAGAAPAIPASPQLRELVETLGGPAADPAARRYADLQKLDGQTQALAADRLAAPNRPPAASDTAGLTVTPAGRVMVDVYVDGPLDAARAALERAGLDVVATSDREPQRLVSGWLPPAAAPGVAALDATRAVLAVPAPVTSGVGPGSVVSQGDAALRGPQARASAVAGENPATGTGVTVGVISDSFNRDAGMAAAQAASNLPANVSILSEGPSGSNEGRAMAELVYDTAPGLSRILFATGFGGTAASKANSVDALVAAGARIITDDVTYTSEPFFQDGVVEQAVDRARAAGVLYVAAAGNSNGLGWEGDYVNGGGGFHDFDPSAAVDTTQTLATVPAGKTATVMLQWDDPWGAATNRFQATLAASDGSGTPSSANGGAGVGGIPRAYVTWTNTSGATKTVTLRIERQAGSGPSHLKYLFGGTGTYSPGSIAEHDTDAPTVGPDASGAAGALTTAAVRWSDVGGSNAAEYFSSRGPLTHYFDKNGVRYATPLVRAKPELAAPDGGNTSVPTFAPFYGTSAASPAAAGIAALLWSASPNMPIAKLIDVMTDASSAIDCLPIPGPDDDCGIGLLRADLALHGVDRTPPVVTATTAPDPGPSGWFTGDGTLTWSAADPDSAVTTSGCGPTAITTDGIRTLTCSATSEAGTASVPVTIRRDATPPDLPTFTGIGPGTYALAATPPAAAIGCASADGVSGVTGCAVTGYDVSPGPHRLVATAVNGAGLSSVATLDYTVTADTVIVQPPPVPPAAAKGLTLTKRSLSTLRGRGLALAVTTARPGTQLRISLKAKLPGARKATTVGTLAKTVPAGKRTLLVALTKKARTALKRAKKTTIAVTVTATASGATKATLTRSATYRR